MKKTALSLAGLLSLVLSAGAEVTTDGSLGGAAQSLAGPDYQIPAEVGDLQDANLFHSFSAFSLTSEESATFSGPLQVEHIIGRVTGGEASRVAGTLRTDINGAQLWMFNPAGWEQSGGVEVPGGLAYAPAEALRLKDGGLFRATQVEQSLLTTAPPQAFLGIRDPIPAGTGRVVTQSLLKRDRGDEELQIANTATAALGYKRLEVEPSACGIKRLDDLSHFVVNRYYGARSAPDEWQGSGLPIELD